MLANSIAVLSFLLLILIRFTTIKNENSRPNIFGILLLLVGFGLMCLQINLNNSNKKRNDFLEQEIKTANLNSERNLIASRPIFKFIKSETKWSEEVESGVRVCVENQGCRAGTSDAVLLRTYKIKDMQN